MKSKLLTLLCLTALVFTGKTFASEHPMGGISFYNASDSTISAKINGASGFKLGAKQSRQVDYRLVSYACAANPSACTARFYADNVPVGSATINAYTGKLLSMNLSMKVNAKTGGAHVLRKVIIRG